VTSSARWAAWRHCRKSASFAAVCDVSFGQVPAADQGLLHFIYDIKMKVMRRHDYT
jgi:hypothetical protein